MTLTSNRRWDYDDLNQLPRALYANLLHLRDTLLQLLPLVPLTADTASSGFPRSPLELAVLRALAAKQPGGASALELSQMIPYPRADISRVLTGLRTLGTVHRWGHGSYVLGPPTSYDARRQQRGLPPLSPPAATRARQPGPALPPSARYAARIARAVAQGTSRETTDTL